MSQAKKKKKTLREITGTEIQLPLPPLANVTITTFNSISF